VAEPSLSVIKFRSAIIRSRAFPRELDFGDPHSGLQELKSPNTMKGPDKWFKQSMMSVLLKLWQGGIYIFIMVMGRSRLSWSAEHNMFDVICLWVWGMCLLMSTPIPFLADVLWGRLQK